MLLRRNRYLADAPPSAGLFAAATYLGLARGFHNGRGFARWNREIEAQLARTVGVVAYSVQRTLFGRNFWTLSLWTDRTAMGSFVAAAPHRDAAKWLKDGRIRESKFAHWETGPAMPSWDEAYRHLGVAAPSGRVLQPPAAPPPGWKTASSGREGTGHP